MVKHKRGLILFLLALSATLPLRAMAAIPLPKLDFLGLGDISQGFISAAVFGLLWLLSLVAGVVVALQTWGLQVILSISFGLVNSAPVRIGFPVVLSIANLAFVAGLIVMAVATILRQDQYGVKKILWKLVVMAIAVNFGLVICGAILGVSDNLTLYFIESIIPAEGGDEGEDYTEFATRIAGAFNPVNSLATPEDIVENPALSVKDLGGVAKDGSEIGEILAPLVSVLAALGTFVIIIITLGTLATLLLYRYVKIGILLITLPLAWTAFVFPSYQSHFKKWWENFTKWAIFPPVAVFFIWLGLQVSAIMGDQNGEFEPLYLNESSSGFLQALSEFFGNMLGEIVGQVLKVIILFGIMMGGLSAAQSMGIKGAEAGIKAVQGANKWTKGVAGRYSGRAARASYQKAGGGRLNKLLADNKLGQNLKPGILRSLMTTAGSGISTAGRKMGDVTQKGGSKVVDQYKKDVPDTAESRKKWIEGNRNMPEVLAALSKMSPEEISKLNNIGGMAVTDWFQRYSGKIKDYNQGQTMTSFKKVGMTEESIEAITGKNKKGDPSKMEWDGEKGKKKFITQALKDGDPRLLSAFFKNEAFGIKDAAALEIARTAMLRTMKDSFSGAQFSSFVSDLDKERKENLLPLMQRVVAGSTPEDVFGPDITRAIRKHGGVRQQGFTSKTIWGEEETTAETEPPSGTAGHGTPTPTPTPPPGGGGGAPGH